MKRKVVITGSASGIGRALADRLRAKGDEVIGVDLHNADVEANLATEDGRRKMIYEVTLRSAGSLDSIVACAGLLKMEDPDVTLSVNYFGAVATLEGLRPLLAQSERPRAVAICSTAATWEGNQKVLDACLAMDEQAAKALRDPENFTAYTDSKRALALWVRQAAVSPQWGGSGILLNGVAPGVVMTEMTKPGFEIPMVREQMVKYHPIAGERYGEPSEIAEVIDFLTSMELGYMLGQIIFVDGGTDAISRPGKI